MRTILLLSLRPPAFSAGASAVPPLRQWRVIDSPPRAADATTQVHCRRSAPPRHGIPHGFGFGCR